MLGRVLRDLERKADAATGHALEPWMQRAWRLVHQRPRDKGKLYALHAPEVECLSKGKARQRYEFGVKVGWR